MEQYIKPAMKVREMAAEPVLDVTSLPVVDDGVIDDGDEILSNENNFDTTWDL